MPDPLEHNKPGLGGAWARAKGMRTQPCPRGSQAGSGHNVGMRGRAVQEGFLEPAAGQCSHRARLVPEAAWKLGGPPTPVEPGGTPKQRAWSSSPFPAADAGAESAGARAACAALGRAAAPAREGSGGEDAHGAGLARASARVSACAGRAGCLRPRPSLAPPPAPPRA